MKRCRICGKLSVDDRCQEHQEKEVNEFIPRQPGNTFFELFCEYKSQKEKYAKCVLPCEPVCRWADIGELRLQKLKDAGKNDCIAWRNAEDAP